MTPSAVNITVEQVRKRIADIRAMRGDDEVAHGLEDDLRRDVLVAIAEGAPNARYLAALAVSTEAIEFQRWCA